jgi:peroxiredoxin
MASLGTPAADFRLPDTDGKQVSLSDFPGAKALLVAFICNHCPFVKHIQAAFAQLAREYQARGVAIVGINSNDVLNHPDDSPAKMVEEKKVAGYTFPYLYDESQKVAQAYKAACTPDFFLFDKDRKLVYRGQMDSSRPGNGKPNDGADLRAALDAVLAGKKLSSDQLPSIGCNIKWKPGNEPKYS